MRRFLVFAIPIVTIAIFVTIMLSGSILKKPLGNHDDLPKVIEKMIQDVKEEAWLEANEEIEVLDSTWKKVMKRIQFSEERDEINYLSTNISRLRGALLAEDKANALMELTEAYNHWKQLGN